MKISARNKFKGTVVSIELGAVMAKVKVDLGNDIIFTSLISKEAVENMNLKEGEPAYILCKSTEVMVAID